MWLLLEKGADVEVKDKIEITALHRAAQNGHEAVIRLLLEEGADVGVKDFRGMTALDWAIRNQQEAVVQLLTSL